MEIVARGLTFEAPDTIPSGWTTLRLKNEAELTHFAVVERLPEGITIADQQRDAAPVFQDAMNLLRAGDTEAAMAKFGDLPPWFNKIVFTGGPGLVAPGHTGETTLYLEPGTYLLECYMKTNGVFHSYNPAPGQYGMVHQLTVTADSAGTPEPSSTATLTLSSANGITMDGTMKAGAQTVAVKFADQKVYPNFVGHDVHLVRLDQDTDLVQLAKWMDWTRPEGLNTPAPVMFMGGAQEMPQGGTEYMHVTLEPGRYAWIAEITDPVANNMLKEFSVGGDSATAQ